MVRLIIGVIVGLLIAIVTFIILNIIKLDSPALLYTLSPLYGCFIAGFIATKNGWLAGFIISIIYIGFFLLIMIGIGHNQPIIDIITTWNSLIINHISLIILSVLCGQGGGFLRHKIDEKRRTKI